MDTTTGTMTIPSALPPHGDVSSVRLRDLTIHRKTTNALMNAGLLTVGDIVGLTVAEVARIPNVGVKSVSEIERALRPLGVVFAERSSRGLRLATTCTHSRLDPDYALRQLDVPAAVVRRLESAAIGCLCLVESLSQSELLRAMDFDTVLTGALATEIERRRSGIHPTEVTVAMRADEAPAGLTGLEAELWSLTAPLVEPRMRRIALEVYGWDGGDRLTLAALAERHGIDAAAISSLCARIEARWKTESARLPRLREAISCIIAHAPALAVEVESELLARDLMKRRVPVEGILAAAAIAGIDTPVTLVGRESRLILPRGGEAGYNAVVQVIRRASKNGTHLSHEEVAIVAAQGGAAGIDAHFAERVRKVMHSLGETTPGVLSHA